MNYVGSISIIDRGDAPAKAIIDKNTRSLAQRVADETKEELDKVMDRVDNIYVSYEMSTQTMFENPRGSPNVEYIEDIKELEEILTDTVKKKKYQQQVTVFVVGFQDVSAQKMQLLQQVNQFFLDNSKLDEDELTEEKPEVDLEEASNKVHESLSTAEELARRLSDLNQDIIEWLVNYANTKASNKGKKRLEKSLESAKNELSDLSEKLLKLQTELEEKDEKFQQMTKQLDAKTQEAVRYKTAAEVAKKSAQDNEAHTSVLQEEITQRDEKILELRTKLSRLEINLTESQFDKEMSTKKLDRSQAQTKEKLAKLQEEVDTRKMAVGDAEREMEKLHKEQLTNLHTSHQEEIDELKKEHNEEIVKLTEELLQLQDQARLAEQQAVEAADQSENLRAKILELELQSSSDKINAPISSPSDRIDAPISRESSAKLSVGKSIAELSAGEEENPSRQIGLYTLAPDESIRPLSSYSNKKGTPLSPDSRQSNKETKKRAESLKPSKTPAKSPNRFLKEKSGRTSKDFADASIQDEGGDAGKAIVEKSNEQNRQAKSKNLETVVEGDGTEFTNAFDLNDEESWASVPPQQLAGRFLQYRQLGRAKVKELEDQLQVTLTKTHRKVNSLKSQFNEHKSKWEAERKVLIEQVEQAQKLQTDAEKEADAAMTQLEEFINEQEKLEDEEEQKRQEIIKTMSRPGTVKPTTPPTQQTAAPDEQGDRLQTEHSEQELTNLLQQTDDAKSRVCSSVELSVDGSPVAPWLTPAYLKGENRPKAILPSNPNSESHFDDPQSRLTSLADAEIQELIPIEDGTDTKLSNISVPRSKGDLVLPPIDGLKGERERLKSRTSSKASRKPKIKSPSHLSEQDEETDDEDVAPWMTDFGKEKPKRVSTEPKSESDSVFRSPTSVQTEGRIADDNLEKEGDEEPKDGEVSTEREKNKTPWYRRIGKAKVEVHTPNKQAENAVTEQASSKDKHQEIIKVKEAKPIPLKVFNLEGDTEKIYEAFKKRKALEKKKKQTDKKKGVMPKEMKVKPIAVRRTSSAKVPKELQERLIKEMDKMRRVKSSFGQVDEIVSPVTSDDEFKKGESDVEFEDVENVNRKAIEQKKKKPGKSKDVKQRTERRTSSAKIPKELQEKLSKEMEKVRRIKSSLGQVEDIESPFVSDEESEQENSKFEQTEIIPMNKKILKQQESKQVDVERLAKPKVVKRVRLITERRTSSAKVPKEMQERLAKEMEKVRRVKSSFGQVEELESPEISDEELDKVDIESEFVELGLDDRLVLENEPGNLSELKSRTGMQPSMQSRNTIQNSRMTQQSLKSVSLAMELELDNKADEIDDVDELVNEQGQSIDTEGQELESLPFRQGESLGDSNTYRSKSSGEKHVAIGRVYVSEHVEPELTPDTMRDLMLESNRGIMTDEEKAKRAKIDGGRYTASVNVLHTPSGEHLLLSPEAQKNARHTGAISAPPAVEPGEALARKNENLQEDFESKPVTSRESKKTVKQSDRNLSGQTPALTPKEAFRTPRSVHSEEIDHGNTTTTPAQFKEGKISVGSTKEGTRVYKSGEPESIEDIETGKPQNESREGQRSTPIQEIVRVLSSARRKSLGEKDSNTNADDVERAPEKMAAGMPDEIQDLKAVMSADNLTLEQQKTFESLKSVIKSLSEEQAIRDKQLERSVTILSLASQIASESAEQGVLPEDVLDRLSKMGSREMSRHDSRQRSVKGSALSKMKEITPAEREEEQYKPDKEIISTKQEEIPLKKEKSNVIPVIEKSAKSKGKNTDSLREYSFSGSVGVETMSSRHGSFSESTPRTLTSSEWRRLSPHDPFSPNAEKREKANENKVEKQELEKDDKQDGVDITSKQKTPSVQSLSSENLHGAETKMSTISVVISPKKKSRPVTMEQMLYGEGSLDVAPTGLDTSMAFVKDDSIMMSRSSQRSKALEEKLSSSGSETPCVENGTDSNLSLENNATSESDIQSNQSQTILPNDLDNDLQNDLERQSDKEDSFDDHLGELPSLTSLTKVTRFQCVSKVLTFEIETEQKSRQRNRSKVTKTEVDQLLSINDLTENSTSFHNLDSYAITGTNCDQKGKTTDHESFRKRQTSRSNSFAGFSKPRSNSCTLGLSLSEKGSLRDRLAMLSSKSKYKVDFSEFGDITKVTRSNIGNKSDKVQPPKENMFPRRRKSKTDIMKTNSYDLVDLENVRINSDLEYSKVNNVSSDLGSSKVKIVDSELDSSKVKRVDSDLDKSKVKRVDSELDNSKVKRVDSDLDKSKVKRVNSDLDSFKVKRVKNDIDSSKVKRVKSDLDNSIVNKVQSDIDSSKVKRVNSTELQLQREETIQREKTIQKEATFHREKTIQREATSKQSEQSRKSSLSSLKAPRLSAKSKTSTQRSETSIHSEHQQPASPTSLGRASPVTINRSSPVAENKFSPRTSATPGTLVSDVQRPVSISSVQPRICESPPPDLHKFLPPQCHKETQTEDMLSQIEREPINGNTEDEVRQSSAKSRASLRNQFKSRLDETRQAVEERRTKSPGITIPAQKSIDDELIIEDDDEDLPIPDDLKEEVFFNDDTLDAGTSPPPSKPEHDRKISVASRKSTNLVEHPVVQEFLRAYTGIHNFKEAMSRVLVDKDQMSASQILTDIDVIPFNKDDKVVPQVSNMTENIYYVLNEVSQVINSVLQNDRGPVVSSLMMGMSRDATQRTILREKSGAGDALTETRGSQRTVSTKAGSASTDTAQYQELQAQYEKLQNQMAGDGKKYEEQQRHNVVVMMEMQDTINQLQRELSALGKQTRRPPSESVSTAGAQNSDSAIMFTRLDSERNAKIMKKAVNEKKLDPSKYKEAVVQMDEYVTLPAQRLAHLVRKYVHHCRMKEIEENVQKSQSLNENVFELFDKMEALQNQRAKRWAERMDEMGIERYRLANMLMETLDSIEQESGLFLIKPMYSYRGREPKEQAYSGKITRPFRPHRTLSPVRDNSSAHAPAPTPASNVRPRNRRDEAMYQSQPVGQTQYVPKGPLEGDTTGLMGASVGYMAGQPRTTWSMNDSQIGMSNPMLGNVNTPRILELDINRMMIGQNTISAPIGSPGLSNDRLVNAANNNLRAYMTVNRPGPNSAGRSERPLSGSRQSPRPSSSPTNQSVSTPKRVRLSDVEIPSVLSSSQPLPPIGGQDKPRSSSSKGNRSPPRIPVGNDLPESPPGSSLRHSPPAMDDTEVTSPVK